MENKVWNWVDFLNHFIKFATVKPEELKISLGSLNRIAGQWRVCNDFERHFTIHTLLDPETGETRVICPIDKKAHPGHYCGSLKKVAIRTTGKSILSAYRDYVRNDITSQINFLESLREHPLILESDRAKNTLERLIVSSHKINLRRLERTGSIVPTQGIIKEVTNCLIRPILLREGLNIKEDNLLNYRTDKDFILLTIQELVENNSGLMNLIGPGIEDEKGNRNYYEVFL